jgi:hypothetical protein
MSDASTVVITSHTVDRHKQFAMQPESSIDDMSAKDTGSLPAVHVC